MKDERRKLIFVLAEKPYLNSELVCLSITILKLIISRENHDCDRVRISDLN